MKLIKRTTEPNAEYNSILDHFLSDSFLNWPASPTHNPSTHNHRSGQPAYNIKEEDGHWHLEIASPGMAKEDFKINLNQDMLIVSTSKTELKEEAKDKYKVRQFGRMQFNKSFKLPENMVNEEDITASYKDGVLHISLPKREDAKANLRREISVG